MSSDNTSNKLSGLKAPSRIVRPIIQKPSTGIPSPVAAAAASSTKNEESSFTLNERVIVNGNKTGLIAFIGEAKFKEGEWAGVILDTLDGKNNGTIDGIQYFQTEENRGIFCRLNKLSKITIDSTTTTTTTTTATSAQSSDILNDTIPTAYDLTVGERVIVNSSNGAKKGFLRYIGTTEFAKGDWAGCELDEKNGKNDGSVNGIRYFQCEALYGVFAPIQKVQRYEEVKPLATPNAKIPIRPKLGLTTQLKRNLSGSQESINSMKSERSTVSVAASQRKPLGLKPKMGTTGLVPSTPLSSTASSVVVKKPPVALNQTVLQQSLKEKEGHVAQLLKERDFERAEFTKAAQRFEQTEAQLSESSKLLVDREQEIQKLSVTIYELKENIENLNSKLEENRSMIEDLEFQLEEHKLGVNNVVDQVSGDAEKEHQTAYLNQATEDMIKQLHIEQDISKNHLEEIKFLKEQLDFKENEVKSFIKNEQAFDVEREQFRKSLDEIEIELKNEKRIAEENCRLREQLKFFEDENEKLKFLCDENDANKSDFEIKIRELEEEKVRFEVLYKKIEAGLVESEAKKSELQFLFDELNIKFNEQEINIGKKFKEHIESLEFTVEEQKVQLVDAQSTSGRNNEDFSCKIKTVEENNQVLEKELLDVKKANVDLVSFRGIKTEFLIFFFNLANTIG
jgi:hypothetical protein